MSNDEFLISNCILEIRPAAGGDEANIWARDLLRMYLKFSQNQSWKVDRIDDLTLKIKGKGAYNKLRHESGVHRVQRVPITERYGRIHTSTASVAVLPQIHESELKINPSDLDWQFYRASSQGGQNVQKVNTAVRLTYKSTGIVVTCQTQRYQEQNRKMALEILRAKLWEKKQEEKHSQINKERKIAVGRGMRAEKIRTYNYAQNRVTDHRIKKKFRLEDIIEGKLEKLTNLLSNL